MSEQTNETTKINETTDGALATNDVELLRRFGEFKERFLTRLEREIVGRRAVLEEVLAGIFAGGHVLLVGVPGLGKTRILGRSPPRSTCAFAESSSLRT